jgi:hypothetical protein
MKNRWWVVAILGVTSLVYFHGMRKKEWELQELHHRKMALEHAKKGLLEEREDLKAQIESQQDSAYVEMVLIKGLGMVPEGQHKVYFER